MHGGRGKSEAQSCRISSPKSPFFTIGEPDHHTGVVIHQRKRNGSHHWCSRWWYTMKSRSFDVERRRTRTSRSVAFVTATKINHRKWNQLCHWNQWSNTDSREGRNWLYQWKARMIRINQRERDERKHDGWRGIRMNGPSVCWLTRQRSYRRKLRRGGVESSNGCCSFSCRLTWWMTSFNFDALMSQLNTQKSKNRKRWWTTEAVETGGTTNKMLTACVENMRQRRRPRRQRQF